VLLSKKKNATRVSGVSQTPEIFCKKILHYCLNAAPFAKFLINKEESLRHDSGNTRKI